MGTLGGKGLKKQSSSNNEQNSRKNKQKSSINKQVIATSNLFSMKKEKEMFNGTEI